MTPEAVDRFEQQYRAAEWVLIPIFVGSNIVFVLSGTVKTRWRRIVPLLLIGLAGRLAVLWWLAKQFESEVQSVTDFPAALAVPDHHRIDRAGRHHQRRQLPPRPRLEHAVYIPSIASRPSVTPGCSAMCLHARTTPGM